MKSNLFRCTALAVAMASVAFAHSQKLTSPEQFFGHQIGADYVLPNYQQLSAYWKRLDAESDRMKVISIGKTAEGRDQFMAIVTSPANHRALAKYREISEKLARGRISESEARKLAQTGKAVVWIDGGLHATEVLGAQQLMETCWRIVSGQDPETRRILDDIIILFVHANPDGMDLVSDWYMRNRDPQSRSYSGIPRLYQKYIGHDNNRDFYASTQAETKNMNRVMYREWYPQVMYNHHQTGPAGTIMFAPPFRDPFNHNIDPLVIQTLEMVGANMHRRMIEEGKPGTTMRTGASYSTWWNGGLRTTAYFHNIVGILTETIGSPNPMRIPVVPDRLVPKGNLPFPIEPQEWKFRQSVEYSHTANMSILDLVSRYRETFLFNMWKMARNSIERGSRDNWTMYPTRVAAAAGEGSAADRQRLLEALKSPELRDARAYIIPSDQADFPTAVKFVNALIENGVEVQRATATFSQGGKTYPAGSLIVRTDQAFRPHIIDMFEPQDHPNDFPAPGAPPTAPYDNAGWTLAYQMGVQFDRALDAFEVPFEIFSGRINRSPELPASSDGWGLSTLQNDAFRVVNRLLAAGVRVQRVEALGAPLSRFGQSRVGDFIVPPSPEAKEILEGAIREFGISVLRPNVQRVGGGSGLNSRLIEVRQTRIGLWDRYGGSMPSGWTRFIFENFDIPFNLVFAKELDEGNLRDKFDVLVFPDGAIPAGTGSGGAGGGGPRQQDIPEEFQHMLGAVTVSSTVPKLKEFLEAGGTIVTIGSSTSLARHLGLPVENHLRDAQGRNLRREEYYVPGSVLRVRVDHSLPVAWGMREYADVMFDNSPVFRIADPSKVVPVAWFDTDKPLRSGWAWGQEKLKDGVAMAQASVGQGTLYLFGPEVLFRAQPHGTFKLVFNAIVNSGFPRN